MLPDIKRDPISGVRPYTDGMFKTRLVWTDQAGRTHSFELEQIETGMGPELKYTGGIMGDYVATGREVMQKRNPTLEETIIAWNEYAEELNNSLIPAMRRTKIDD